MRALKSCQERKHFTTSNGARNKINTVTVVLKCQNAELLPNRSCFKRPVDLGFRFNMHWSDSAAPLCTSQFFPSPFFSLLYVHCLSSEDWTEISVRTTLVLVLPFFFFYLPSSIVSSRFSKGLVKG